VDINIPFSKTEKKLKKKNLKNIISYKTDATYEVLEGCKFIKVIWKHEFFFCSRIQFLFSWSNYILKNKV
jgi:hypothetical protein